MTNKLKKFFTLPWQKKIKLLHAFFLLGIMRAAILTLSFKRLSRSLQHHPDVSPSKPLNPQQLAMAQTTAWAVVAAARYTPWQSTCLAQVLTAQRMLVGQHIPGMFFLGVKKDQQQMEAHAWLQCDGHILTGKADHEAYSVVSTFSWL